MFRLLKTGNFGVGESDNPCSQAVGCCFKTESRSVDGSKKRVATTLLSNNLRLGFFSNSFAISNK